MNEVVQWLSVQIILDFLQQGAADTLYSTTNDLAFDQHRVDHHTAIVRDDIVLDLYTPNLDIDIDDRRMHCIRPRDRWRLVISRSPQALHRHPADGCDPSPGAPLARP